MLDFTHRQLSLDNYFDKIFYINLKNDVARNESILHQFRKFGITNFERIEAIQLTELPTLIEYRNFNKKDQRYILGQLSCRASHVHLMRIARERNYSRVLVFEDDIAFLQDPNLLLAQNHNNIEPWDMLYFGGLIEPFFRNQVVCTHAYAIRNTLFSEVINMADASGMEIDNFYAKIIQHMSYNYNQSGRYNIKIIQPFNQVIQSTAFASNIQ